MRLTAAEQEVLLAAVRSDGLIVGSSDLPPDGTWAEIMRKLHTEGLVRPLIRPTIPSRIFSVTGKGLRFSRRELPLSESLAPRQRSSTPY